MRLHEPERPDKTSGTAAAADPYRWLEDEKDPRVREFVSAQDREARQYLHALPGRERLVSRLRSLFYVDAISAPRRYGSHHFYSRTHADKEKAVLYVRTGRNGAEQVLLDPNQLSADGSLAIGSWLPSPDGKVVVYAERVNNSDEATLRILDVDPGVAPGPTGLPSPRSPLDVIPGARYAHPSFTPDGSAFFYTYLPTHTRGGPSGTDLVALCESERPGFAEVRLHRLGTDAAADVVVYPCTGSARTFVQPELSRDGRYLFIYLQHGWSACDIYFCDLHALAEPPWGGAPQTLRATFRPLREGIDARYQVTAWQDRFYIFTNEDAPRGRVLVADPETPERAAWRELIGEDLGNPGDAGGPTAGSVITDVTLVGGALGVHALHKAHSVLRLYDLTGAPLREVRLPGLGQSYGFIGNPEDDEFFYHFTSFTQPPQIFRSAVSAVSAVSTGSAELWAEVRLPIATGADSPFTVEQVVYPSRDGTPVTLFLIAIGCAMAAPRSCSPATAASTSASCPSFPPASCCFWSRAAPARW